MRRVNEVGRQVRFLGRWKCPDQCVTCIVSLSTDNPVAWKVSQHSLGRQRQASL
jgi:hypothetical protein